MNSQTDGLRDAVLTDVRARAYSITQEALQTAQQSAGAIETDIAAKRESVLAEAEREAERRRREILAASEAEIRTERRAHTEGLIRTVVESARGRLREVASDPARHRAMLLALAIEGAGVISDDAVRLCLREADRDVADDAFLGEVAAATGKRVELAKETITTLGGLIVEGAGGRERYDNTLDSRLERRLAEVRAGIHARLSDVTG